MTTAAASLSVYKTGEKSALLKDDLPDFSALSKPTTIVDVTRLQNELQALHSRLAILEHAALNPPAPQECADNNSEDPSAGSSSIHEIPVRHKEGGDSPAVAKYGSDATSAAAGGTATATTAPGLESAGSYKSEAPRLGGKSKKAAALAAEAMKAQIGEISERVEALAASARHREKAQGAKEKSITLARTMETNGIRLAIASRVTSDELQQATKANTDKIVALESHVESELSDRFRRIQDMVHDQMAGLLQLVQGLVQQQRGGGYRGSKLLHGSSIAHGGGGGRGGSGWDSDDSDGSEREQFKSAVTDIVQELLQEAEEKRGNGVESDAFQALQEDYETFKGQVEEKADRQDDMASAVENAKARLQEAEDDIAGISAEMESSAAQTSEVLEKSHERQSRLEETAEAAKSLATDAHKECAATRVLVGVSKREGLAEAKKEAEYIAGRAEGRVRAEVQKARGDSRSASDKLSERLRFLEKKMTDEREAQKTSISNVTALSEKAMDSAESACTRAADGELALERTDAKLAGRIAEMMKAQTKSSDDIAERIAEGEAELCRARDSLERLIAKTSGNLQALETDHARLEEAASEGREDLRVEIQDVLAGMVLEEGTGTGGGSGRTGIRSGGAGTSRNHRGTHGGGIMGSCLGRDVQTLSSLGAALRKQGQETAEKIVTLQRSGVGIATIVRKLEGGLQALSIRDLFWQAIDVKLVAHQRSVGKICLQVEDCTTLKRSRITLPKEAQACLAGDMQRVGKLLATKADYEVIREIAKLDGHEQTDHDWDERVESLRRGYLRQFARECRETLDRCAPELRTNFKGEEIRGLFFGKLNDALRVALSKYSPTTPGVTLFGKIKLKAKACVACDRPFTPSATGKPGPTPAGGIDGAAVEPARLPEENSHITKDAYRPHTSHGRLGSSSHSATSPDLFEPQTSIHSVMSGGRASPLSPHVFRGGFKLPKQMKSPLHAPCDGSNQSPDGIGHTSALLHKCPTMTGLYPRIHDKKANNQRRPSTSGGIRGKSRPPTIASRHEQENPSLDMHLQMLEDNGSIVSAFTMQTDESKVIGAGEEGGGRGRRRGDFGSGAAMEMRMEAESSAGGMGEPHGFEYGDGGEVPQRDDDPYSRDYVGHADLPSTPAPPLVV